MSRTQNNRPPSRKGRRPGSSTTKPADNEGGVLAAVGTQRPTLPVGTQGLGCPDVSYSLISGEDLGSPVRAEDNYERQKRQKNKNGFKQRGTRTVPLKTKPLASHIGNIAPASPQPPGQLGYSPPPRSRVGSQRSRKQPPENRTIAILSQLNKPATNPQNNPSRQHTTQSNIGTKNNDKNRLQSLHDSNKKRRNDRDDDSMPHDVEVVNSVDGNSQDQRIIDTESNARTQPQEIRSASKRHKEKASEYIPPLPALGSSKVTGKRQRLTPRKEANSDAQKEYQQSAAKPPCRSKIDDVEDDSDISCTTDDIGAVVGRLSKKHKPRRATFDNKKDHAEHESDSHGTGDYMVAVREKSEKARLRGDPGVNRNDEKVEILVDDPNTGSPKQKCKKGNGVTAKPSKSNTRYGLKGDEDDIEDDSEDETDNAKEAESDAFAKGYRFSWSGGKQNQSVHRPGSKKSQSVMEKPQLKIVSNEARPSHVSTQNRLFGASNSRQSQWSTSATKEVKPSVQSNSKRKPFSLSKAPVDTGNRAKRKGHRIIPGADRFLTSTPPPQELPLRRSERKKKPRKSEGESGEIIELLSEDDEAETENNTHVSDSVTSPSFLHRATTAVTNGLTSGLTKLSSLFSQESNGKKTSSEPKLTIPVPRIAIGTEVFRFGCQIMLGEGVLQLEGENSGLHRVFPINLQDSESVTETKKYYSTTMEDLTGEGTPLKSCIVFKVKPDETNCLRSLSGSYNSKNPYIVVEFSYDSDLKQLLDSIQQIGLGRMFQDTVLSPEEATVYCASLIGPRKRRSCRGRRSINAKVTDKFVAGRDKDEILLVYPFDGDSNEMEEAAEGMQEASGQLFAEEMAPTTAESLSQSLCSARKETEEGDQTDSSSYATDDKAALNQNAAAPSKPARRRHFLTVRVRDFERLCPGEFLNDTLIDFWIQWITRKFDPEGASVHCFSSHFFTTLQEGKPAGVEKWTSKRGINVFQKKFIFIPINETLHWSLCVVVNPGEILNSEVDGPRACILFFDSLKAHRKQRVATHVRKWLDAEWGRHGLAGSAPFRDKTKFPLFDPKIPYQDNSWDCGVFVCRYAYSVYCLRNEEFCRNEDWYERDLTSRREFKFDMVDIERLRENIRVLIQRLSKIYIPWKEDQLLLAKERRKQEKLERLQRIAGGSGTAVQCGSDGNNAIRDPEPPVDPSFGAAHVERAPLDKTSELADEKYAVVASLAGTTTTQCPEKSPADDYDESGYKDHAGGSDDDTMEKVEQGLQNLLLPSSPKKNATPRMPRPDAGGSEKENEADGTTNVAHSPTSAPTSPHEYDDLLKYRRSPDKESARFGPGESQIDYV